MSWGENVRRLCSESITDRLDMVDKKARNEELSIACLR